MSDTLEQAQPKRGRPRADEPRSSVTTWIRVTEHDRLIEIARRNDVSVSSLVRQLLVIGLRRK